MKSPNPKGRPAKPKGAQLAKLKGLLDRLLDDIETEYPKLKTSDKLNIAKAILPYCLPRLQTVTVETEPVPIPETIAEIFAQPIERQNEILVEIFRRQEKHVDS